MSDMKKLMENWRGYEENLLNEQAPTSWRHGVGDLIDPEVRDSFEAILAHTTPGPGMSAEKADDAVKLYTQGNYGSRQEIEDMLNFRVSDIIFDPDDPLDYASLGLGLAGGMGVATKVANSLRKLGKLKDLKRLEQAAETMDRASLDRLATTMAKGIEGYQIASVVDHNDVVADREEDALNAQRAEWTSNEPPPEFAALSDPNTPVYRPTGHWDIPTKVDSDIETDISDPEELEEGWRAAARAADDLTPGGRVRRVARLEMTSRDIPSGPRRFTPDGNVEEYVFDEAANVGDNARRFEWRNAQLKLNRAIWGHGDNPGLMGRLRDEGYTEDEAFEIASDAFDRVGRDIDDWAIEMLEHPPDTPDFGRLADTAPRLDMNNPFGRATRHTPPPPATPAAAPVPATPAGRPWWQPDFRGAPTPGEPIPSWSSPLQRAGREVQDRIGPTPFGTSKPGQVANRAGHIVLRNPKTALATAAWTANQTIPATDVPATGPQSTADASNQAGQSTTPAPTPAPTTSGGSTRPAPPPAPRQSGETPEQRLQRLRSGTRGSSRRPARPNAPVRNEGLDIEAIIREELSDFLKKREM